MKKILLFLIFVIISSPVFALSHKQRREHIRHVHAHWRMLHRENKILRSWMKKSEIRCHNFQGIDFHYCYIHSMKEIHARSKIRFSSETEKMFRNAIKPPKHVDD
jgi:hypothetical protein